MGLDIDLYTARPLREREDFVGGYKQRNNRKSVTVSVRPSNFSTRNPEIWLTLGQPERALEAREADTLDVRIHGVTVVDLINQLVRSPVLFGYLASAVDHLRANPGDFDDR
jgi:hypothetical protein